MNNFPNQKQLNQRREDVRSEKEEELVRDCAGSESDASVRTVTSEISEGRSLRSRKRERDKSPLFQTPQSGCTTDEEAALASTSSSGQKKSRRKEFLAQKQKTDLGEEIPVGAAKRAALGLKCHKEGDNGTAAGLKQRVLDEIGNILMVSTKSKNLKGTYKCALTEAVNAIKSAVEVLYSRSSTEETAKLQADNNRLRGEMAELRKELTELREEVANAKRNNVSSSRLHPTSQSPGGALPQFGSLNAEEFIRTIMLQVGGMVNARLEAFEDRLPPEKRLRPPLAADRRNASVGMAKQPQIRQVATPVKDTAHKKGEKEKKGKKSPELQAQKVLSHTLPPVPQSDDWVTVVRKGRNSKKKKRTLQSAEKSVTTSVTGAAKHQRQTTSVKLRPPKSSAVVLTLQPEAMNKGETYAKILTKAREAIDLSSCGITGLKIKTAATGARILEIPGTTSGDKADTLARKLKEALGDGLVGVSRPVKRTELRISGLDDSITPGKVIAAVSQRGGCPEETVQVGEIRSAFRGMGSIWVRCPLVAAKKIAEDGRFLIGWVSAKVELLQPRTLRCYRCLQSGHVRARCTAEVDRSNYCYRCGKPGHKAMDCSAAPLSTVCSGELASGSQSRQQGVHPTE